MPFLIDSSQNIEMKDKQFIIAIDGVSGAGKSSTAKAVAKALNILYLDTGAMYRAVTYLCQEKGIPPSDSDKVAQIARNTVIQFGEAGAVFANGADVSRAIRTPQVSAQVSDYCAIPEVRQFLVACQREIGASRSSVLDGRDIGTVVFPDAQFKFYLFATPEIRAKRRLKELKEKGIKSDYRTILANLHERDSKDSTRRHGPLQQAVDAEFIDTTNMDFSDQVKLIVNRVTLEKKTSF
jgi:cytidylate kinase